MYYWNTWYSGAGWFLWFGVVFLMLSSMGNWGYTYQAHRRLLDGNPRKEALDILNERYARGDIDREEYTRVKSEILSERKSTSLGGMSGIPSGR